MIDVVREITHGAARDAFVWHVGVFKWGLTTWKYSFGYILSFTGLNRLLQVDGHDSTFARSHPVAASAFWDLRPLRRGAGSPSRQIADIRPILTLILRKLRLHLLPKLAYSLIDIGYEYCLVHIFSELITYTK